MAKRGRAPMPRVVQPVQSQIRDAREPIAVQFRFNFEPPFQSALGDHILTGHVIAWTPSAALVVWREGPHGMAEWLPAAHVRRLDSPQVRTDPSWSTAPGPH